MKTAHQKLSENVSEQKMRFQIILNETIQNSVSRPTPSPLGAIGAIGGGKDNDRAAAALSKPSSNTSAAVAAANAYISRLGDERKKQELEKSVAAAAASLASLGSQFDRFSLADYPTSSIDSSNMFGLRSIIDNTATAANVVRPAPPSASSWWSAGESQSSTQNILPSATQTASASSSSSSSASSTSGASSDDVRARLLRVFTAEQVDQVMRQYPNERDYAKLTYYANEMFFE